MANVRIIPGPATAQVSREEATKKLKAHPQFPRNASVALDEVEGRWVAAISVESAPPAFLDKGPSTDDAETDESTPSPEDKAPEEAEEPEGPPSDDGGPPKDDKKDKGKGGEKAELGQIVDMLHTLFDALGLPPPGGPEDSPVPDEIAPPGPEGPPPGPPSGGPPGGAPKPSSRPLKPGDTPPGGTPIGAPSFSSVSDKHPWKQIASEAASFTVEEPIGNQKLSDVEKELKELGAPLGLKVRQLQPGQTADGQRTAKAIISRY